MSVVSVEKDYDGLSLVLVAEFDAPVDRVWQLWSDPRQLERWWGPPSHPSTVVEHELAAGGAVTYFMTAPDGGRSHGWWEVTAVDPLRSIEFTDGFGDRDGRPDPQAPTTAVQVELSEREGGGTRMVLRFRFGSVERMRQLEQLGAFHVFPQSVAQMDAVLAR